MARRGAPWKQRQAIWFEPFLFPSVIKVFEKISRRVIVRAKAFGKAVNSCQHLDNPVTLRSNDDIHSGEI